MERVLRDRVDCRPKNLIYLPPAVRRSSSTSRGLLRNSGSHRIRAEVFSVKGTQRQAWHDGETLFLLASEGGKINKTSITVILPEVGKPGWTVSAVLKHMDNPNLAVKPCKDHWLAEGSPIWYEGFGAVEDGRIPFPAKGKLKIDLALATSCKECKVVSLGKGNKSAKGHNLTITIFNHEGDPVISGCLPIQFKHRTHRDKKKLNPDERASNDGAMNDKKRRLSLTSGSSSSDESGAAPVGNYGKERKRGRVHVTNGAGTSDASPACDSTETVQKEQNDSASNTQAGLGKELRNLSSDNDADSPIRVQVATEPQSQRTPWYDIKNNTLRLQSSKKTKKNTVPVYVNLPPVRVLSQCYLRLTLSCTDTTTIAVKACELHAVEADSPIRIEADGSEVGISSDGLTQCVLRGIPENGEVKILIARSTVCPECVEATYNDKRKSAGMKYRLQVEVVRSSGDGEEVLCTGYLNLSFTDKVKRNCIKSSSSMASTSSAVVKPEQQSHEDSEPRVADQTLEAAEASLKFDGSHTVGENIPPGNLEISQSSISPVFPTALEEELKTNTVFEGLSSLEVAEVVERYPYASCEQYTEKDFSEMADFLINSSRNAQEDTESPDATLWNNLPSVPSDNVSVPDVLNSLLISVGIIESSNELPTVDCPLGGHEVETEMIAEYGPRSPSIQGPGPGVSQNPASLDSYVTFSSLVFQHHTSSGPHEGNNTFATNGATPETQEINSILPEEIAGFVLDHTGNLPVSNQSQDQKFDIDMIVNYLLDGTE